MKNRQNKISTYEVDKGNPLTYKEFLFLTQNKKKYRRLRVS